MRPLLSALLFAALLGGCMRAEPPAAPVSRPDPAVALMALLREAPITPARSPARAGETAVRAGRHTRADGMLGNSNDGRSGYLLREVGGATRFASAAEEVFEPASTLKIVYLLRALEAVDSGSVSLASPIPWFRASTEPDDPSTPEDDREWGCPVDKEPAVGELGVGLRAMMERSDNRWTQAVRSYFGEESILAAARGAGMERTVLRHRMGCATDTGGEPGQTSAPNASTLAELCGLMEGVASGMLLSPTGTEAFFDLMANDPLIRLHTIFREENALVGLPEGVLAAVERLQFLAWKSGKYNIGTYKCQSVVGLARLVSYSGGDLLSREYVFGVFVDDAHRFPEQGTRATLFSLAVASELLRDEIRSVLSSYRQAMGTSP